MTASDQHDGKSRSLASVTVAVVVMLSAFGCRDDRVDGLLADLAHRDAAVRRTAIKSLAEIEAPSERVIAAIEDAADDGDRDVRRIAMTAFGKEGDAEVASLLETGLSDTEVSVRMAAAYSLLTQEPEHQGAIDVLVGAMKRGDGGVIVRAGHEKFLWAVPTLVELLRDRRPGTRRIAADSLGLIGPLAAEALPALEEARQDGDDRVRDAVAAAIDSIRADAS